MNENDIISHQEFIEEISNYKNLLSSSGLKPMSDEFCIQKKPLPVQAQLLIKSNSPETIKSGSFVFQNNKIFWVSSTLKIVFFTPDNLDNCFTGKISKPVNSVFPLKSSIVIAHNEMAEVIYFDSHAFESKNNIYSAKIPLHSTFKITCSCGDFIGCSDGGIRSVQIMGRYPYTKLLINHCAKPNGNFGEVTSMQIVGKYMYAFYGNEMYLCAFQINGKMLLQQVGAPLRLPGKFTDMDPFCDSVMLSKQMGGTLSIASILDSSNSFIIKAKGVLVDKSIPSNYILETRLNSKNIILYVVDFTGLSPCDSKRDGNLIHIYVSRSPSEAPEKKFEIEVNPGDILIFQHQGFEIHPFSPVKDQLISFHVNDNQNDSPKYDVRVKFTNSIFVSSFATDSLTTLSPPNIFITDHSPIQNPDFEQESSEYSQNEAQNDDIQLKTLKILSTHKIIHDENKSLKSLFGFDSLTHSIWGKNGLFCFIYNDRPTYGQMVIMRFGFRPAALYTKITNLILSYSTFQDKICIFTTDELIYIYENPNSKSMKRKETIWEFLLDMTALWNKETTIQNIREFQHKILDVKKYSEIPTIKNCEHHISDALKISSVDSDSVSSERIGSFINNQNTVFKDIQQFYDKKKSANPSSTFKLPSRMPETRKKEKLTSDQIYNGSLEKLFNYFYKDDEAFLSTLIELLDSFSIKGTFESKEIKKLLQIKSFMEILDGKIDTKEHQSIFEYLKSSKELTTETFAHVLQSHDLNQQSNQTLADLNSRIETKLNEFNSIAEPLKDESLRDRPNASYAFSTWSANNIVQSYFNNPDDTSTFGNVSDFRLELFNTISKSQRFE